MLPEPHFLKMLALERQRTERSCRPFILMILEAQQFRPGQNARVQKRIIVAMTGAIRQTDIIGWYETGRTIAVLFTEISDGGESESIKILLEAKMRDALAEAVSREVLDHILISCHVFPDDWNREKGVQSADERLYPDLAAGLRPTNFSRLLKRALDVVAASAAVFVFSTVLLVIAIAIKLTSKGPVILRQERVGFNGRPFKLLKFRSMYTNNDPAIHERFIKEFIAGKAAGDQAGSGAPVYKLTNDPRITPVGHFLRKSSLDELPQLFNVIGGEMSLVGPRPPIPYELAQYDIWHRRRLVAAIPGLTGLWQVSGRSKVTFDEMVRLDLKYAASWSLATDMKLLALTPRVVLFRSGAY